VDLSTEPHVKAFRRTASTQRYRKASESIGRPSKLGAAIDAKVKGRREWLWRWRRWSDFWPGSSVSG
jgi:hypothetical protein